MPETLAVLFLAHVLADFVFQTNWMVRQKRQPGGLAVHGAVVFATAAAATGGIGWGILWLTALHLAIDAIKARTAGGLGPFLLDQAAHLAAIAALAIWQPMLWSQGLWAGHDLLPPLMLLVAGALVATRAGGFAVGFLMAPFADKLPEKISAESLPGAGRVIGLLERGLIFTLILLGQAQGVGLLIAAKSILRFGAVRDDRALSEYVIIGTLASFGWAILAGYVTVLGLGTMAPLGIPPATP